jgi:hypothetical protein
MIAALVGVAGIAYYVQTTPGAARVADDLRKTQQVGRPSVEVSCSSRPSNRPSATKSKYLIPVMANGDVALTGDLGNPADGQDDRQFVIDKTFQSMGVGEGRALKVEVKDGLASVDVNAAMVDHGYGSMEEGQMVKALQLALGQFPEISTFRLLLEGQPAELGHLDFSEPIEVIRPETKSPETKSPETNS